MRRIPFHLAALCVDAAEKQQLPGRNRPSPPTSPDIKAERETKVGLDEIPGMDGARLNPAA